MVQAAPERNQHSLSAPEKAKEETHGNLEEGSGGDEDEEDGDVGGREDMELFFGLRELHLFFFFGHFSKDLDLFTRDLWRSCEPLLVNKSLGAATLSVSHSVREGPWGRCDLRKL